MPLDKPTNTYPSSPTSIGQYMPNYIQDPSIRGESFDQLINNRGVRFIHKVAALCPNMKSLDDNNHQPECPFCNQSQILFVKETEIHGTFSNNQLEKLFEIQGVWEVGSAVITFPTEYDNGEQADFNVFDQLVCPDFEIRLSDLKQYVPMANGRTSLKYPIIRVVDMTSITNNVLKKYLVDVDFTIVNGEIQWIKGRQPKYDSITLASEVLSITYNANPVYNVLQTLHELRITQQMINGVKTAKRLPQQVLVKREFLFKPDNSSK